MSRSPNTTTAPTGSIAPFGLRMLPELKERLEAAAKANGRSMNAELVDRLQRSADLIDELALLKATHAYDQSVNTALMREKGELQAQLAKKDAEIQILKQRLFLGTVDVPEVAELKHALAAQDTEKELLRETFRHLHKIISSQEVNLIVLSTYLVDVLNQLPQKLRKEDRIKAAAEFVMGLGEGPQALGQQTMLPLDTPRTVETIKATVRGKTVDTGIVAKGAPRAPKKTK